MNPILAYQPSEDDMETAVSEVDAEAVVSQAESITAHPASEVDVRDVPEVYAPTTTEVVALVTNIGTQLDKYRQAGLVEVDYLQKTAVGKVIDRLWPGRNIADSTRRELIRQEAAIGGRLFGKVEKGLERQFFYHDGRDWLWSEDVRQDGRIQTIITRYRVTAEGVIKMQDGQPHQMLVDQELTNFALATQWYYHQVVKHLYS
jgi:hypothetical protein